MMRTGATSSKAKQCRGTIATIVIASSLAKKVEGILIVGPTKTCSNGGSREDKCGNGAPLTYPKYK